MSSKEVGTNMGILAESCTRFSIQKYSYSNSTTWLVTASRVYHFQKFSFILNPWIG